MKYNWTKVEDPYKIKKYSSGIEMYKECLNRHEKVNPIWEEIKDYVIKKKESLRLTYILYGFLQDLYCGLEDKILSFNGSSFKFFLSRILSEDDLFNPSVDKIKSKINSYIEKERELEEDGYRVFCREW